MAMLMALRSRAAGKHVILWVRIPGADTAGQKFVRPPSKCSAPLKSRPNVPWNHLNWHIRQRMMSNGAAYLLCTELVLKSKKSQSHMERGR